MAANVKLVLEKGLRGWLDTVLIGSDSEIALMWVTYEHLKLEVFQRNRAINTRMKVDLEKLFHVSGNEIPADVGTRPDLLTTDALGPNSEWILGKDWMRLGLQEAIGTGIVKKIEDINLQGENKENFKKGVSIDPGFEILNKGHYIVNMTEADQGKVAQRIAFSKYIYPPLRRSFRSTVRIISLVLVGCNKFKKKLILNKMKRGEVVSDKSELKDLNFPPVKFVAFPMVLGEKVEERIKKIKQQDLHSLTGVFRVEGIALKAYNKKTKVYDKKTVLRLSEEELSAALEYLYKKATGELIKFIDKKELDKIGVMKNGVMFCKTRILEGQTLRSVGNLANELNLQSFTGVGFNVPLIDRFSPLAISIANHLHYNVTPHMGKETIYRLSLQHVRILKGQSLFKEISEDCVKCAKLRKKYLEAIMGPLQDCQLSISPVFYDTIVDLWGDVRVFVPGYEKVTRGAVKEYKIWIMIFACAATGTVNLQVIEKKDTDSILTGFNRFFVDCCVPKVVYPDKEGSLMAALNEGEISIMDLQGQLSTERGIYFETCSAQGHNAHGRVERKIGLLKESLARSNIVSNRLHAMGWLTIAKLIERDVNSIPLGFITHTGKETSLNRVLTPAMLKLNSMSDRAPVGVFTTPDRASELMDKIFDTYSLWYKVWSITYVPQMMDIKKWHVSSPNLKVGHIVYFKVTESKVGATWRIGRVEFVKVSNDGVVRTVGIAYKTDVTKTFTIVERPVRQVIRLFHLEDTSLIDQIKQIQEFAEQLLDEKKIVSQKELVKKATDGPQVDDVADDCKDKLGSEKIKVEKAVQEEVSIKKEEEIVNISSDTDNDEKKPEVKKRRRKTEVERLKIENKKFREPLGQRRNSSNYFAVCSDQFCSTHLMNTEVEDDQPCIALDIAGGELRDIMYTLGSKEDGGNTTGLEYGAGVFEGIQCYVDPDEDERGFLI